ncbi:conserved hypothetical protein [Leishmania major strain Friedlin]|uniref:Uncharacterized protein n=1 Tax=Leishmania major TaxID=5664 RepID=Q4QIC0_LEIMA|nr:conserved hypothetical protein [Leishmania major strain Friedlin]CAG9569347.1 hypothetical_protein_-_conserved [Leishmania major strain Friedlin]CAJ02228.1 conserved hypothetical protein [Leishmania major strain Friedlin]|eukprot:XP_001681078.1 conserved hypothetical protein [Leishmania major strain Friedlin]
MLQRFSNVSEQQNARGMSPPHLASTPPPSPPRAFDDTGDAERAMHVSPAQHGGGAAVSLERVPVSVPPVCASNKTAGAPSPARASASSQSVRTFSPALLSQLLLAEAARAEAAAAAVAQQQCNGSVEDGSYASAAPFYAPRPVQDSQLPPRMTTTQTTRLFRHHRDSGAASLHEPRPVSPSSVAASPSRLPMDYLTVSIGVVPLPDSEMPHGSAAPRKRSRWWPWSLTAPTVTPNAETGVVGEAAGDTASRITRADGNAAEASWLTVHGNPTVSVHQLHPLRLYTSGRQHTAGTTAGRSSTSPTLKQFTGVTATVVADNVVSIEPSRRTMDVLGWSGVFADVPLALPGARLTNRPGATGVVMKGSKGVHARGGDRDGSSQSEALFCSGAASISVILA